MGDNLLVNPDGNLLPEIVVRLVLARKTKPLWAKMVEEPTEITSLEGVQQVNPGDWLCWGIQGEPWPQSAKDLHKKYDASGVIDDLGRQRFDPKPDAPPVEAIQMKLAFRVIAAWGELTGKPGDYVVRSTTDPRDIWIVDKTIFEASYEEV